MTWSPNRCRPRKHDPKRRVRKGDAAYHTVRRSILLGHFQAGELLLEQRIAERLNCSQGTVREALLRLGRVFERQP